MFYILLSYIVGSIPFGIIFSKLAGGPDPRTAGSRNIGFTNVLRTVGKLPAFLTLFFDMSKGTVFLLFLEKEPGLQMIAAFAAVLGHSFSIFLKFRGGKGVATGFGVITALSPITGLVTIILWIAVFAGARISSLAAIVSYLSLPFSVYFFKKELLLFSVLLSMMILCRHNQNIRRLISGEEFALKKVDKRQDQVTPCR